MELRPKVSSGRLDNLNFSDKRVTLHGDHAGLAKARPDTMANLFLNTRPPFSALARNVKHHDNGVTSYDITALGPKFAYKPVGVTHLEVNGQRFSIVEVEIGPDKKSGAQSVYSGTAYQIYGEGPKASWAAELWDDVKADSKFTDAAANLHNRIVDGGLGDGGYRGLANKARDWEKQHAGKTLDANQKLPGIHVSDGLLAFFADPKNVRALSPQMRSAVIAKLEAERAAGT